MDIIHQWFAPTEGILISMTPFIKDRHVTGKNMFGDMGGTYADGYEKLQLLDRDADHIISGVELNDMAIWVDANSNTLMMENSSRFNWFEDETTALVSADASSFCKQGWEVQVVQDVLDVHKVYFEKKGVSLFLGHKQEYVSHGQYGGHMEYFRWLEFVDREEQPNYYPQRDVKSKQEKCVVS